MSDKPTIKELIKLWEQAESGKAFAEEMMFLLDKHASRAAADAARAARDEEREACAATAAKHGRDYHRDYMEEALEEDMDHNEGASAACSFLEMAIRARGKAGGV
jgi:hypothetical protein